MPTTPEVREFRVLFLLKWVANPIGYLGKLHDVYGDIFRKDIRGHTHFFPVDPRHTEHVLSTRQDNYNKHPLLVNNFAPFLGKNSLLTSNDFPQWQRDRALARTAFDAAVYFERYAEQITKHTKVLLDRIRPMGKESTRSVEIGPEIDTFALNNINDTIFHDVDIDTDAMVAHIPAIFRLVVKKATSLAPILWRIPTKTHRAYQREVEFLGQTMSNAIKGRLARGKDYDDLLGTLMHDYGVDSVSSVHFRAVGNQMMTFNVVGYTSTTSALRWMITMLALHPEVQRRVAEEVSQVCGAGTPRYADLPRLEYTRAFISEVLRMYPPLVFLTRQAVGEDEIGGHRIGADDCVILDAFHVNRHRDYWKNPETFNPERFLSKPYGQDYQFAYIPFGAGRRSCIGMQFALLELTIVAAMLLQRVRFALPADFDLKITYVASVFIRPNLETIQVTAAEAGATSSRASASSSFLRSTA